MMLVLLVLFEDYCGTADISVITTPSCKCAGLPLSKCNFLQMLVSIEVAVMLPTLVLYLSKNLIGILV